MHLEMDQDFMSSLRDTNNRVVKVCLKGDEVGAEALARELSDTQRFLVREGEKETAMLIGVFVDVLQHRYWTVAVSLCSFVSRSVNYQW